MNRKLALTFKRAKPSVSFNNSAEAGMFFFEFVDTAA